MYVHNLSCKCTYVLRKVWNCNYSSKNWRPAQTTLEAGVEGLRLEDVNIDSRVVAAKQHQTTKDVRPLVTPIYTSSSCILNSVQHFDDICKEVDSF